jgi:hypothetical protein
LEQNNNKHTRAIAYLKKETKSIQETPKKKRKEKNPKKVRFSHC